MKVPGLENAHLTYCLNVHPGATLVEAMNAILEKASIVCGLFRDKVGAEGPCGLGSWFSAEVARAITRGDFMARLAGVLVDYEFYLFTLNGFPYGRFHGARVKENVYRPDWAETARRDYTFRLARILERLMPSDVTGSISTLPVTFRSWATEGRLEAATRRLVEVAGRLADSEKSSGKTIVLALEPEPGCFLERAEDVVEFFEKRLLPAGAGRLPEETIRRHIGVCLDTVHAATLFEDPVVFLRRLRESGIRVVKVQLGGALAVEVGAEGPPGQLSQFADDVYLHQVAVRGPDGERFYLDLPEALAEAPTGDWRVHFHVPLTWEGSGGLAGTGGEVDERFVSAALESGVEHFELEVYTLDVMPDLEDSPEFVLSDELAHLYGLLTGSRG